MHCQDLKNPIQKRRKNYDRAKIIISLSYNNPLLFHCSAVSTVTVPILFTVGIVCSIAIESFNNSKSIFTHYIIHLTCGIICALVFQFVNVIFQSPNHWDNEFLLTATLIAVVYITIFVASDYWIKLKYFI